LHKGIKTRDFLFYYAYNNKKKKVEKTASQDLNNENKGGN
jgi:hypothetical protein